MNRIHGLDALRGLAILAMMVANLQAILVPLPHPMALRVVGSVAAPLFVVISGFMVSLTASEHSFGHSLRRGAWLIGVGIFVDLIVWGIYPAMSAEVLYLIGLAVPLVYLATRLPSWGLWGAAALVLLAPPLVQAKLGYAPFPIEFYLSGVRVFPESGQTSLLTHWLGDGWFPVFPWVGFALFGAGLSRGWKQGGMIALKPWLLWGGLGLAAGGIASYFLYPPQTFIRGSWSEMFYPPTIQYEAAALGAVSLLLLLFLGWGQGLLRVPVGALAVLGRASLGLYFGHLFLGYQVLTRGGEGWGMMTWLQYAVSYAGIALVLGAVAWGYEVLGLSKKRVVGRGLRGVVAGTIIVFIASLLLGRYPLPGGFPIWPGV